MKSNFIYMKQLNSLLEDESNITFFFNLVGENIVYDHKFCLEIMENVIEFCDTYSLYESKAYMLYYLVWVYFDSADFQKALKFCLEAKNIFESTSNKKGLAMMCNALGAIYNNLGYNDLAADVVVKGLQYSKELENNALQFTMLINAAEFNLSLNHIQNAEDMMSYIRLNMDNKYIDYIEYKCTMLSIKIKENKIDEALELLDEAYKLDIDNKVNAFTVHIKRNYAVCYARKNMIEKAKEFFCKAIEISDDNYIIYEKCLSLLEYGKFLFDCNLKDEAIKVISECIDITKKYKLRNILLSASYALYSHYKNIKDFKNSLYYFEIYTETKDEQDMCYLNANVKEISGVALYKNLMELLYGEAETIANIGESVIAKTSLDEITESLNGALKNIISKDYLLVSMLDDDTGIIDISCILGVDKKQHYATHIDDEESFTSYCINKKKSILINNFQIEYKKYVPKIKVLNFTKNPSALSSIYIPLFGENKKVIGSISVQSNKVGKYSSKDMSTLTIISGYVSIAIQNALSFKKIEEMASYDSLTGILTRREIIKEGNMLSINYDKTGQSFCILMIDIDDFKYINNTYGHVTGDEVLKLLTKTIKSFIRNDAYIGRYGGDEFLILCPNTTTDEVLTMAERIRRVVANTNYMVNNQQLLNVTLSMGLYEYNKTGMDFINGVKLADNMLYEVKNTTKNAVICC